MGWTPLHYAVNYCCTENVIPVTVAKLLLDAGATLNAADSVSGLQWVIHVGHSGFFGATESRASMQLKSPPTPLTGFPHTEWEYCFDHGRNERPPRRGAAAAQQQGRHPRSQQGPSTPPYISYNSTRSSITND